MKRFPFKLLLVPFVLFNIEARSAAISDPIFIIQTSKDTLPVVGATVDFDTTIFKRVEKEASFPGGLEGWRGFLEKHLKADVPARKKAPVGQYMVMVQFIVDKKGELSDIKALTQHGYGMEEEVLRVLRKSPKWKPAIQDGRPVKAYRNQPITFVVSDK